MNDEYDPTRPFQSGDADADLDWEDEEGSPKLLWGRVLALAGILLLAFLLGRATSPDDSAAEVEELQEQLQSAEDTIEELQAAATAIPTLPTDAPTVTTSPTEDEPTDEPTDEETDGEADNEDGPSKTYTVQPGDTFVSIAEDEFGDANPDVVSCLVDANGGDDIISPGDEVEIPQDCGE